MSQFRQNIITKEWVLIAPNRSQRPDDFAGEPVIRPHTPDVIDACVFCPGNESKNPDIARFPAGKNWQVRIIPNKFEIVSNVPVHSTKEFYVNRSGIGEHEVMITRKHNEPVALQSLQTVELSLHTMRQRYLDLAEHGAHHAYIEMFHNHGRDAGASLIHPHYQIITLPMVPPAAHEEISGSHDYYRNHGVCVYCDMIKEEKALEDRIIHETQDFIIFEPYAARFPFETWLVPKKHSANFEKISDQDITQMAFALKLALGQLYAKLSDPPLNFYIHTLPAHAEHSAYDQKSYHWHLTILPRTAIWGGFEYATGIPINPVSPEQAAKFLK